MTVYVRMDRVRSSELWQLLGELRGVGEEEGRAVPFLQHHHPEDEAGAKAKEYHTVQDEGDSLYGLGPHGSTKPALGKGSSAAVTHGIHTSKCGGLNRGRNCEEMLANGNQAPAHKQWQHAAWFGQGSLLVCNLMTLMPRTLYKSMDHLGVHTAPLQITKMDSTSNQFHSHPVSKPCETAGTAPVIASKRDRRIDGSNI